MVVAAVGLGSNLDDPVTNVRTAIEQISKLGKTIAVSDLYHSRAWGYEDQPDFCNAAMLIDVEMTAVDFLTKLQEIERSMGRTPTFKWGPRLIDLDILYFGDEEVETAALVLPHPFMNERAFVLKPLAQIDKRYVDALNKLPQEIRDGVQILEVQSQS